MSENTMRLNGDEFIAAERDGNVIYTIVLLRDDQVERIAQRVVELLEDNASE